MVHRKRKVKYRKFYYAKMIQHERIGPFKDFDQNKVGNK